MSFSWEDLTCLQKKGVQSNTVRNANTGGLSRWSSTHQNKPRPYKQRKRKVWGRYEDNDK
jgi:hypothetical protein